MAITKQYLKSKPVCKVTFTVPAEEAAKVFVVGDFNDWNPKKGTLRKETSYEFRYLIDDSYVNETEADGYQWNEYAGTENAVLEL